MMTKQEEHDAIKKQVEEYLAKGGRVHTLPAYVDQPNRPAHTNIDRRLAI